MSKQEELKWDPDEIPGWTSYIYRLHRFREPHEYVNYWKWAQKAGKTKEELGLSPMTNEADLCEIIKDQQKDLGELKQESRDQREEINGLYNRNTELTKTKKHLQEEMEKHRADKQAMTEMYTHALEKLKEYGTHTSECNWVIMLQSGRLHDTEEEQCDCGWLSQKQSL